MPDRVPHAPIRSLGAAALTVGLIVSGAIPAFSNAAAREPGRSLARPAEGDVGVLVNGTAIVFDQPPLVRDGRVYVPLRGIFERLGASVVFAAGRIAASAGRHAVALAIGEPSATVDGVVESLDAPPLVVAGRTLVPLRFVSQALGATVAYDAGARTVAVDAPSFAKATVASPPTATPVAVASRGLPPTTATATDPNAAANPNATTGHARAEIALRSGETPIAIRLLRIEPAANGRIAAGRPEISATFAESVDPAAVRLVLDGGDVTGRATIASRSFTVVPPATLAPGSHEISLAGRTPDRDAFVGHWTFETTSTNDSNYLSGIEPTSGAQLRSTRFAVSGYTRPQARVRVVGTTSPASTAFADGSDASAITETVADRTGFFETRLALADRGSGVVDVRIASIAPGGAVAIRTLRLRQ